MKTDKRDLKNLHSKKGADFSFEFYCSEKQKTPTEIIVSVGVLEVTDSRQQVYKN